MNRRILRGMRIGIGLLLVLIMLAYAAGRVPLPFVDSFERQLYDLRLRLTMPGTRDQRIAIVDIDEKSLAEIGRWPWRRDRMAALVNTLFDYDQVRVLGFDIVMAEPDDSSGLRSLESLGKQELAADPAYLAALGRLRPQLDFDGAFAAALRDRPVVLGYYLSNEGTSSGALPAPSVAAAVMAGRRTGIAAYRNHGGNLALFQSAAASAGHFNPVIDPDGSVRRVPLLARHDGQYYAAFSLALARAYYADPALEPLFSQSEERAGAQLEALALTDSGGRLATIAVDDNLAAWVPYRGPSGSFAYYSAADVLARRVGPEQLRGKLVIIGTTAPGLRDLRTTPVGEIYPGMEVHANLVSGILDQRIKLRPDYGDAVELLLLGGLGMLMIFGFPWQSPVAATLATLTAFAVVIAGNLAMWQFVDAILPLAGLLFLGTALYSWNMAYGYFVESRAKLQITQRFGQYVPPELVSKMVQDPGNYSMESRKAELTVLFSDVRGFTTISEGLEPEQLAQLMNQYLTAMTLIIRRHGGTLDKYIGDAIVAFWGAPVQDPQHARNAVLAALEMQAALVGLNQKFAPLGWPEIQVGIGINTGQMTVGDMGSSVRLAYTVMGDAVNLGARLESKTKEYGVSILVGQGTQEAAGGIAFRELDCVQVKGKHHAVRIFQPLAPVEEGGVKDATAMDTDTAEHATMPAATELLWTDLLKYYRAGNADAAQEAIERLRVIDPDSRLYALYDERITALRHLPDGAIWDGITRFDSK